MANHNQAPQMGETNNDDSTESSDMQPIFLDAAFEADKRAKEENQRRILEFLSLGSEEDDDDKEDTDKSKTSSSPTVKKPASEVDEAKSEAVVDQPEVDSAAVDESSDLLPETDYDMASESVVDQVDAVPAYEDEGSAQLYAEEDQPDVPDIEPATASAQVESVFDQQWTPDQGVNSESFDPDSKAEVFDQTSMDEETPRSESGIDTPPPPPDEPPNTDYDNFDTPPPPPHSETEFEQPPEEPPEESPAPRQEVIVDRHSGGVGAALIAFFAANWLSRRRDRKIRREAKRLEKDFQNFQEKSEADSRHVREVQRKAEGLRQEQVAKISHLERANSEQASARLPEAKEGPIPLGEVLATTNYTKDRESSLNINQQPEASTGLRSEKEVSRDSSSEQKANWSVVEAGRESGREIDYERQKEAKPDPVVQPVYADAKSDSLSRSALDEVEASLSRRHQDHDELYKVSMPGTSTADDDLYQKSIVAGVAVGVAVVVLAAAFYLLMF